MASWADLRAADPELAAIGAERLLGPGLVMVGTRRANGWARLSPVEPLEVDGVLYLGMIWQSYKALELLRDPKVSIQSVVTRADGIEGDVKLYGTAAHVADAPTRERYCEALFAHIGWRPEGDFHLFAVDICEVGFVVVEGSEHRALHWSEPSEDPA
jgi:hypothetical protein